MALAAKLIGGGNLQTFNEGTRAYKAVSLVQQLMPISLLLV
jgi:hypothetical protein